MSLQSQIRMYLEEGKLEVPVQLYGITGENVIQTTLGREGGRVDGREGGWEGV